MLGVALSSESPLLRPITATHVPLQNFSPKFLRFFNFRFHTKSSRPNNSLLVSGCSRQLCGCKYDGLRGNFILKEVKTSKRKCCCTARLPHAGEECNLTRKSTLLNRPRKNEMGSAFEVLNISHDKFLKFVSMSGLLALLGTQEAIAASDIATGLQATSIFGDLGDISTGILVDILL